MLAFSTLNRHATGLPAGKAANSLLSVIVWLGLPGLSLAAQAPAARPSAPVAAAPAQEQYKEDVVDAATVTAQKRQKGTINKILQAKKFSPAEQQQEFDTYYRTFALKRWGAKENYHMLQRFRAELISDLKRGKSGPPHDQLVQMTMTLLGDLAKENYDPAVRYNAMLMIGSLNSTELEMSQPPVPYAGAITVLLEAVHDANQIDAVKLAAILGIGRHAALNGITAQDRSGRVIPTLLQFATAKVAPGRSGDGQAWMRMRAIEVLASVAAGDGQAEVAKALAEIAGEREAHFNTRCAAARALGQISYQGVSGLDPVNIATTLGQLAADACRSEIDAELPDGSKLPQTPAESGRIGGVRGAFGDAGGYGTRVPVAGAVADPALMRAKDFQVRNVFRRQLKSRVQKVWEGLYGVNKVSYNYWPPRAGSEENQGVYSLAVDPAHRAFVTDLLGHLKSLLEACDDKPNEKSYDVVVDQVETHLKSLNQFLAAGAGQTAAAETR